MSTAAPIRAGDLKRQITIEQRSSVKDSFGQEQTSWTTFCTTRAAIEQVSGSESMQGGAQVGGIRHNVTIRYRPGIRQDMRVRYQGRVLEIVSVLDEFTGHRRITLECQEGLTRG